MPEAQNEFIHIGRKQVRTRFNLFKKVVNGRIFWYIPAYKTVCCSTSKSAKRKEAATVVKSFYLHNLHQGGIENLLREIQKLGFVKANNLRGHDSGMNLINTANFDMRGLEPDGEIEINYNLPKPTALA